MKMRIQKNKINILEILIYLNSMQKANKKQDRRDEIIAYYKSKNYNWIDHTKYRE
jgi:hypothetical protein